METLRIVSFLALITLGFCRISKRDDDDHAHAPIQVTTIISEPFMMLAEVPTAGENETESAEPEGNDRFEGFLADMLEQTMGRAELPYEIHVVPDGRYGMVDEFDNWSGMIGEITDGSADLIAAALTKSEKRAEVVQFLTPFMSVSLTALVPQGSIVSSMEDLVNNSDYQIGMVKGGSTSKKFESSTEEPFNQLWQQAEDAEPSAYVDSLEDGLKRVREGGYAFVAETPWAEYEASQPPCDIRTTERFVLGSGASSYAFAVEKNSKYLEKIEGALKWMKDEGKIKGLYQKWWGRSDCNAAVGASKDGATMLTFSIIALIIGLLCAYQ